MDGIADGLEFGAAWAAGREAESDFFASAERYRLNVALAHKSVNVNKAAAVAAGEIIGVILKEQSARHKLNKKGFVILRPELHFSKPHKSAERNRLFASATSAAMVQHFRYEHLEYGLDSAETENLERMKLIA